MEIDESFEALCIKSDERIPFQFHTIHWAVM